MILTFTAAWSGTSAMVVGTIDRLRQENPRLLTYNCDVIDYPNLTTHFGVSEVPSTVLLFNGRAVDRFDGLISLKKLREVAAPYLTS